jgi:hypothetical protein
LFRTTALPVIAAAVVFCLVPGGLAQDSRESQKDGVALSIASDKNEYRLGEAITLRVELRNFASAHAVYYSEFWPCTVIVEFPDSKERADTGTCAADQHFPEITENGITMFQAPRLSVGKTLHGQILVQLRLPQEPGTFTVVAQAPVYFGPVCDCPVLRIPVTEKPP